MIDRIEEKMKMDDQIRSEDFERFEFENGQRDCLLKRQKIKNKKTNKMKIKIKTYKRENKSHNVRWIKSEI